VFWNDAVPAPEVEPSLYAADFARLGEQIDALLDAGAKVFHYDVGDGHFVEPIIIGPIVLESIAPRIHDRGGFVDVHLMVERPQRYFAAFRGAGADSVTVHLEAVDELEPLVAAAREHGLGIGVAFKPGTSPDEAVERAIAADVDLALCMSIEPGYSGQSFMPEAFERLRRLRERLPDRMRVQVDGGVNEENVREARSAGADLLVAATAVFGGGDPAAAYRSLLAAAG
jgi:ribulose-phosphate 3-epimerase